MSFTRPNARADAYKRFKPLGRTITLDSAPASVAYLTNAANWTNDRLSKDELADLYAYLPTETGSNQIKQTGDLVIASGRLVVQSAYGAGVTATALELTGPHPELLNDAFINAQRRYMIRDMLPFSMPTDGDMRTSGVTNWTTTSGNALTKNTTASNVLTGPQSLFLNADGSTNYAESATVRVTDKQSMYTAMIARADIGTVTFQGQNVTGSAVSTAITNPSYSGEDFALLERLETPPTNCEEWRLRATVSGATDDVYIDCTFGPYIHGKRAYVLPSQIDQGWKLLFVRPMRYTFSYSSGVYDANSGEPAGDLREGIDYDLDLHPSAANPSRIIFYHDLPDMPIWLAIERPSYDVNGAVTTETGTVDGTLEEFMPLFMHEIFKLLAGTDEGKGDPEVKAGLEEYGRQTAIQAVVRTKHVAREKGHGQYRNARAGV